MKENTRVIIYSIILTCQGDLKAATLSYSHEERKEQAANLQLFPRKEKVLISRKRRIYKKYPAIRIVHKVLIWQFTPRDLKQRRFYHVVIERQL